MLFLIDQSAAATELKIDQVATDLENGFQQLQRMSSKVATDDQSKSSAGAAWADLELEEYKFFNKPRLLAS